MIVEIVIIVILVIMLVGTIFLEYKVAIEGEPGNLWDLATILALIFCAILEGACIYVLLMNVIERIRWT